MTALNFPASPTLNQTYTANGRTWQWDGVTWVFMPEPLTSAAIIAALGYEPVQTSGNNAAGTWGISISGSAATASSAASLSVARTLTIGATGKTFNGSANVSWSLSEIGAAGATGAGASGTWGISISGNAATATALQTARTINGTSFNGTASITTANWGTSRTLTIGGTGKSVDGSGNVSWSLTEIGVPSTTGSGASGTWGISITGNAATVSGLTLTSVANGVNPDSVTQNQIGYNNSVSLFGQSDGGLYSSAHSSSWIHQIYGDFRSGQIAIRGKNNGTWQSWRTVLDSGNFTSYVQLPYTGWPGSPGTDANSFLGGNWVRSSFTYSNNAPYTGAIATIPAGGYDLQFNGSYTDSTGRLAFRNRNGDNSTWQPWRAIWHDGNMDAPNKAGTSYYQVNTWLQLTGAHGLYAPDVNGAHFSPNPHSYGAWYVIGSRNGWRGLEFESGLQLMMNYNSHGIHRSDTGWMLYSEGRSLYIPGIVQAGWSDSRLKDNQRRVERRDVFGTLSKIRAHRFSWNKKAVELGYEVEVGDEEVGLIAQHVKAAIPIAAAVNKSGASPNDDGSFDYLTIRWDKIAPFTVEAVNIHEEDIALLRAKVESLESAIRALSGG